MIQAVIRATRRSLSARRALAVRIAPPTQKTLVGVNRAVQHYHAVPRRRSTRLGTDRRDAVRRDRCRVGNAFLPRKIREVPRSWLSADDRTCQTDRQVFPSGFGSSFRIWAADTPAADTPANLSISRADRGPPCPADPKPNLPVTHHELVRRRGIAVVIAARLCCLYIKAGPAMAGTRPRGRHRQHPRGRPRVARSVANDPAGALRPTDPTLHIRPCGPARFPESARHERNPGRGGGTDDNESEPSGGQGNNAGGQTHASACLLPTRDAASLTPASATHRPCRAITPHTLDA